MNSIKINYNQTKEDLYGKSKWWGQADLPENMPHPMIEYEDGENDPMTMICQIRCADLAPFDPENLLPHEGMLYFFADIDEYVNALHMEHPEDEEDEGFEEDDDGEVFDPENFDEDDYHNGMGEWSPEAFRVLYSPTEEGLKTHQIFGPDGQPYELPAEKLLFENTDASASETRILGTPFETEVEQEYPEYINLLEVWEEDRWGFFMYDCGILNFLIKPEDLKTRRFDKVIVSLHSC